MNSGQSPSTHRPDQRWLWAAAIALAATYAVLTWLQRVPVVTTRNDDAVYILLARELANFSYAQSWLVGAPTHSQYPPGYPALLAILRLASGENLGLFAATNVLLVVGGLLMIFDILRRYWPPVVALVFLAVTAVSPPLHDAGARILSEASYFFLTAATLWLIVVKPTGAKWIAAAIAAAIAASLTRSIGLTIIFALAICWVLEGHRRRVAVLAVAALVCLGSWLTWTVVAPEKFLGGSYVKEVMIEGVELEPIGPVRAMWDRVTHHAKEYWTRSVPHSLHLATLPGTRIDNLFWLLSLTGLTILGYLRLWKHWRGAALYLAGYAGVLLIWPWVDNRLLIPIMPFLVVLLLAGVDTPWVRGRARLVLHATIILVVLGMGIGVLQHGLSRFTTRTQCDRAQALTVPGCLNDDQRSLIAGAKWAKDNLPAGEAVVSLKEGTLAYYSEREILHLRLLPHADGQALIDGMSTAGVRYVFLDRIHSMTRNRIGPILLPVCDQLRLVAAFPPRSYLLGIAGLLEDRDTDPQSLSACEALTAFTASRDPDQIFPGWW